MPDWREDAASAVDLWIASGAARGGRPEVPQLERLRDSLLTLTDAGGLAERLAHGRIDPLPPDPGSAEPAPDDLEPDQRQAFHACLAPGIRLVWAPPGSGRTRVLAEAIDRLVERGRRVLLLSARDDGMDGALLGVTRALERRPGTLLRILPPEDGNGPPGTARPSLSRRRRPGGPEASVDGSGVADRRGEGDARALARELRELMAAAAGLDTACAVAALAVQHAESAWEAIQPARAHLIEAERLRDELATLQLAASRAAARRVDLGERLATMRGHLEDVDARPFRPRRRGPAVRHLRWHVARLDAAVRQAEEDETAAVQQLDDQRRLLAPRIARHEQAAAPMDRAAVQTRWDELDAARRQAGEAQRRIQEAGERVAAMRRELLDAEARPAPTGERRREVGGGPGVVATTLALFRLRLDVAAAGPYDTVLVDDVGASTLAEVLPAVAMASRTAVLLGDFLQPEAAPRGVPRRWPVRTCFSHCGIRTADDARGCPGCAVLSVKQPAPG